MRVLSTPSNDQAFRSQVVQILAVVTALQLAFLAFFVGMQPEFLRFALGVLALVSIGVAVFARRVGIATHGPGRILILIAMVVLAGGALVVTSPTLSLIGAFSLLGLSVSAIALDEDRPGVLIGLASNVLALGVIALRSDVAIAASIVFVSLSVTATFLVVKLRRSLTAALSVAVRAARSDPLTDLLNRRGMEVAVPGLDALARASGRSLGCLVLDLDHFKSVNDLYGHRTGDEVLARTGAALKRLIRGTDVAVRTGGEEFAVFVAVDDLAELEALGERIRGALSELANPRVTVSIGGAIGPGESVDEVSTLFERADRMLYLAKRAGRNRVQLYVSDAL